MSPPEDDKANKRKEQGRDWVKYTGLGFQMIATICAFVFLGIYLDGYLGIEPILTIVLSLTGVAAGLYVALRDFL